MSGSHIENQSKFEICPTVANIIGTLGIVFTMIGMVKKKLKENMKPLQEFGGKVRVTIAV